MRWITIPLLFAFSAAAAADPLGADGVVHTLRFYGDYFLHCGARTFTGKTMKSFATGAPKSETEWTELKDMKVELRARPVSEPEMQKGIDWAGSGEVHWTFDRHWWPGNGWTSLQRYQDDHQWDTTVRHFKGNRGWVIEGAPGSYLDLVGIPGACTDVPSG